jgi:hypothetical protein
MCVGISTSRKPLSLLGLLRGEFTVSIFHISLMPGKETERNDPALPRTRQPVNLSTCQLVNPSTLQRALSNCTEGIPYKPEPLLG